MKTKIAALFVIWLIACVPTKAQVSYDVISISTLGDRAGSAIWNAQPMGRSTTDCCRKEKCPTCCQKSGRSCCCRPKGVTKQRQNHTLCCDGLTNR